MAGEEVVAMRTAEIVCSFDGVTVLDRVSITFPAGSIFAVVGRNGSGKTTLLNVITGFLVPDSGRCLLGSTDITGLATYSIARLGVVRTFQGVRLAMGLSVLENVLVSLPRWPGSNFWCSISRRGVRTGDAIARERAGTLLGRFGLDGRGDIRAGALSYGQQKLLALACAAATDAHVHLFDEPVAGVDPGMRANILDHVLELRERGACVVFVEHDIDAVREIADWVAVLDGGRLVAAGRVEETLRQDSVLEVLVG